MPDDDQQQDDQQQDDDATQDQNQEGDDTQQQDDDDDKALGPPGEKALAAEKDKRRAAQSELREWKALGLSREEIAKILEERNKDDQPDPERIRSEAKAEAQAELMQSRVLDKIEAKAARLFADPDDAAALLLKDHDADDFLDDGKIDVEAIQDALDGLLQKKPYLAAAQSGKRFQGSADGGARKETRPSQLTRADLVQMSPEAIEKARTEGRLDDLMSGKSS